MRNPAFLTARIARLSLLGATAAFSLSLAACGSMSPAARDTAIGATAGAVVGGVITGGSTTGAAVGAAVGGVIGNEVNRRK